MLVRDGIAVVKLPVKVHVRPVDGGGHCAGGHVLDAEGRVAKHPAQHKDRRVHRAAQVVAQIQHNVFDRAVRAGDLLVGMDDQGDGVVRRLAVLRLCVVGLTDISGIKAVEGDVGRVADLFIGGDAVRVFRGSRLTVGIPVFPDLAVCHTGAVADVLLAGHPGVLVEDRVQVVEIVVDEHLEGVVRVGRVVAAQRLVNADLPEGLGKGVDIVGALQAVQIVQHHAQLIVAVLGQGVAALRRGGLVIQPRKRGVRPLAVIEKQVVARREQGLAVEEQAESQRGRDKDIAHRLHRDKVLLPPDVHPDPVVVQIEGLHVAVAVEGFLLVALKELCLPVLVKARLGKQVDERGIVGAVLEGIVIVEGDGAFVKVKGHGVAVFALDGHLGIIILAAQLVAVIAHAVLIQKDKQIQHVVHFQIRQIVDAVEEIDREGSLERILRVSEIEGVLPFFYGLLSRRARRKQPGKKDKRQHQRKCSFHVASPLQFCRLRSSGFACFPFRA